MFKKRSSEELAELPLDKKGIKEGRSLLKGVKKFLRYNNDLISDEKLLSIEEKREAFASALENPSSIRKDLQGLADDLTETCKRSVKNYSASAWKENLEVVFVAVVIAMGIRAYFVQQFKIPTGSMQPTLNGIVGYPDPAMNPGFLYSTPEDYEPPALPQRIWDKIWYGRSHVEWIAEEDDALIFNDEHFYGKTYFIFFPRTHLITRNGHKFTAPGTKSRVRDLLNQQLGNDSDFVRVSEIKKGQTIARGWIDTGDQLVVNKFIYHWKRPERGDVFVFNTRDIPGIQRNVDPRMGSQHYIKRLVGMPGDELEIRPPELYVNGARATEPGIVAVMEQTGGFVGYSGERVTAMRRTEVGTWEIELEDKRYWAMGDNSANSSDSRAWGPVPERNIVGRAAFVYYPFGHHFGNVH